MWLRQEWLRSSLTRLYSAGEEARSLRFVPSKKTRLSPFLNPLPLEPLRGAAIGYATGQRRVERYSVWLLLRNGR